jgi:hypothetical protein
MVEERDVRIIALPEEPLRAVHHADKGFLPVRVGFDATPLMTRVVSGERLVRVAMDMAVHADDAVSLCITLCEPLCVTSDYAITLAIFDRPVATIRVRGITRLARCGDENQKVVLRQENRA